MAPLSVQTGARQHWPSGWKASHQREIGLGVAHDTTDVDGFRCLRQMHAVVLAAHGLDVADSAAWLPMRGAGEVAARIANHPWLERSMLALAAILLAALRASRHAGGVTALGELGLVPASAWLHAAGVGAMGGLVLGVMSRVALGHTGRPLVLPKGIASAFVLIHAGAVLRVAAVVSLGPWLPLIAVSTICWVIAYGLFVARYAPILLAPRPDGRPG